MYFFSMIRQCNNTKNLKVYICFDKEMNHVKVFLIWANAAFDINFTWKLPSSPQTLPCHVIKSRLGAWSQTLAALQIDGAHSWRWGPESGVLSSSVVLAFVPYVVTGPCCTYFRSNKEWARFADASKLPRTS